MPETQRPSFLHHTVALCTPSPAYSSTLMPILHIGKQKETFFFFSNARKCRDYILFFGCPQTAALDTYDPPFFLLAPAYGPFSFRLQDLAVIVSSLDVYRVDREACSRGCGWCVRGWRERRGRCRCGDAIRQRGLHLLRVRRLAVPQYGKGYLSPRTLVGARMNGRTRGHGVRVQCTCVRMHKRVEACVRARCPITLLNFLSYRRAKHGHYKYRGYLPFLPYVRTTSSI